MTDPRQHRHVVSSEDDRLRYVCGCINVIDPRCGALRSMTKCPAHIAEQKEAGTLGLAYYTELGTLVDGVPQCDRYVQQLQEAMGPFPAPPVTPGMALEVGCGVSMYANAILEAGYRYNAIEPSEWAANWTRSTYGVQVLCERFEVFRPTASYHLVIAAHSLEHMDDAPDAIHRCGRWLAPGGELWIVIPNDEDPLNPDHLFTFNESSLKCCIEQSGLTLERMVIRRYIERENFIYCRARKSQA